MPRKARKKSSSGIYHIVWRGANRQNIFHDDEDRMQYLATLSVLRQKTRVTILSWCFMSNHVHLLIKEGDEEISVSMKRLAVSYAIYYNRKYYTVGHLFQDTFRSENVETDAYLLTVTRYIHQNPVKAGMVQTPADWKWSSCSTYYGESVPYKEILHDRYVLQLFSDDLSKARLLFQEYNERTNLDICLEDTVEVKKRLNDQDARAAIQQILGPLSIPQVKILPREKRLPVLRKIKRIEGISQRQAARILGISPNIIFKA